MKKMFNLLVVLFLVLSLVSASAESEVRSSEESRKAIVADDNGHLRTMMVLRSDLLNFVEGRDYEVIRVTLNDGWYLLVNGEGVVGEVLGREAKALSVKKAGARDPKVVKKFFSKDGNVLWSKKSSHVREGWAAADAEIALYQLEDVEIVHFFQESFNRLVAVRSGEKASSSAAEYTPVTPVTGTPVTPVESTPVTPVESTPVTPVESTPVTPVESTPVTPVESTPVTPVESTPATPVEETPAKPEVTLAVPEAPAAPEVTLAVPEVPAAPEVQAEAPSTEHNVSTSHNVQEEVPAVTLAAPEAPAASAEIASTAVLAPADADSERETF